MLILYPFSPKTSKKRQKGRTTAKKKSKKCAKLLQKCPYFGF